MWGEAVVVAALRPFPCLPVELASKELGDGVLTLTFRGKDDA